MNSDTITLDRPTLSKSQIVDVSIPAKVAVSLDLKGIHELERDLFEKLGHPGCYSGFDIRWRIEEQFFVNEALAVQRR